MGICILSTNGYFVLGIICSRLPNTVSINFSIFVHVAFFCGVADVVEVELASLDSVFIVCFLYVFVGVYTLLFVDVDTSVVVIATVVACRLFKSSRVFGPTIPGYGASLFARWNDITASLVIGPKYPVVDWKVK